MVAAMAIGLFGLASPAQAAGICGGGLPFGFPLWQYVNLAESNGSQIQIFRGGTSNNQFIVRFAKGPGANFTVLGSEVGVDEQHHTTYGSTTDWGSYPNGWCSNASQGTQIRISVTYVTNQSRYWVVGWCNTDDCHWSSQRFPK